MDAHIWPVLEAGLRRKQLSCDCTDVLNISFQRGAQCFSEEHKANAGFHTQVWKAVLGRSVVSPAVRSHWQKHELWWQQTILMHNLTVCLHLLYELQMLKNNIQVEKQTLSVLQPATCSVLIRTAELKEECVMWRVGTSVSSSLAGVHSPDSTASSLDGTFSSSFRSLSTYQQIPVSSNVCM